MEKRVAETEAIVTLIKKRLDGVLTDDEHEQLQRWLKKDPSNEAFLAQVLTGDMLWGGVLDWLNMAGDGDDEWPRRLESQVMSKVSATAPDSGPTIRRLLPYAAAILLFVTLGLGYYFFASNQPSVDNVHVVFDVAPGGNKASLTMPDGRTLELSGQKDGIVMGDELTYIDGTFLAATDMDGNGHSNNGFSVLSTPIGGQYQVTLSDGTKVWLNAASTLKYPVQFSDSSRVVELDGEAYFEVAKVQRKTPFLVKTQRQAINVLGTTFNVCAYADEPNTKTTLVEGKVSLTSHGKKLQLLPGEQGVSDDHSRLTKNEVDVFESVAWKDNLFVFNETELRTAMNQLNRWYNLEVVYEDKIPDAFFYGEISRSKRLSEVLKILRKGGVNFRIERTPKGGNKLTVLRHDMQ